MKNLLFLIFLFGFSSDLSAQNQIEKDSMKKNFEKFLDGVNEVILVTIEPELIDYSLDGNPEDNIYTPTTIINSGKIDFSRIGSRKKLKKTDTKI